MKPGGLTLGALVLTGIALTSPATAFELFAEHWARVEDAGCKSYGAQPGTGLYFQCRFLMALDRRAQAHRNFEQGIQDLACGLRPQNCIRTAEGTTQRHRHRSSRRNGTGTVGEI